MVMIPTQTTADRIVAIDALRGFALFGIFFAHMIMWFVGGPLPEVYYTMYQGVTTVDQLIANIHNRTYAQSTD